MATYNQEQLETLRMVRRCLDTLPQSVRSSLRARISKYLKFREDIGTFLEKHFASVCHRSCFENRLSACCSREGIITFFADVVINALLSRDEELTNLERVLAVPNTGYKCVYLGSEGCLWNLKPIVCEIFLCDAAKEKVFAADPSLAERWEVFVEQEKLFKWPDRPVLFDDIERIFMDAGCRSPLMYLHNSPGLLRVKARARECSCERMAE